MGPVSDPARQRRWRERGTLWMRWVRPSLAIGVIALVLVGIVLLFDPGLPFGNRNGAPSKASPSPSAIPPFTGSSGIGLAIAGPTGTVGPVGPAGPAGTNGIGCLPGLLNCQTGQTGQTDTAVAVENRIVRILTASPAVCGVGLVPGLLGAAMMIPALRRCHRRPKR